MSLEPIDKDSPELRAALARLAGLLSDQLCVVEGDLKNAHGTPWQCCDIASRLGKLRYEIEHLRKAVQRLTPGASHE